MVKGALYKPIVLFVSILALCGGSPTFLLAGSPESQVRMNDYAEDRIEIALRAIGDDILRDRSDFGTPLPPLVRQETGEWRMRLPVVLALDPDRLAESTVTHLSPLAVPKALVTVHPRGAERTVYGFSLDYAGEHTLPCLGRLLPANEYSIVFRFPQGESGGLRTRHFTWVAVGLLLPVAWLIGRYGGQPPRATDREALLTVDRSRNELRVGGKCIRLTEREAQVLALLADGAGEVVTREQLIEKIWTADGVITDRSLDVYISRLRGKIAGHGPVRITTVRGRGYTLEVGPP